MRLLIRYFAYILLISSIFRIVPIITGVIYSEVVLLFIIGGIISIIGGVSLLLIEKRMTTNEEPLSLSQALILVALSFIILPLVGSISFLPTMKYNVLDAVFESVSGFTTTGLTMYPALDDLPRSLLIWRAETQWMGGIGIIMVFLFVMSHLGSRQKKRDGQNETMTQATAALYQAQGYPEKLEPSLKKSSTKILIIYGSLTLLGIVLLLLTGMPFFESVGMTFTSLSTGGFTLSDNPFSSNIQLTVLCIIMILGSISFITHNKLLSRKFKEFFRAKEKNIFLAILAVAILLTLIAYPDFKMVAFELVSALTTTGFSLTDISLLPHLFIMMIMLCMMIGGGLGSTSGGMKVSRVYSVVMMIPWFLKKLSSPSHAIVPFKSGEKPMEESDLLIISVFVFSFISILVLGTIIFLLLGYGFLDSSFQVVSALGTVGLQTMPLAAVPVIGKVILMLCMLLGRLEIFPLLLLFRRLWKR